MQKDPLIDHLKELLNGRLRTLADVKPSDRPSTSSALFKEYFSPGGNPTHSAGYQADRLTAAVLTLVLLHHRGLLPELERAPEQFIRDLFSLLTKKSEEDVSKLFAALSNEGIGRTLWSSIAKASVREVVLVHWPKVDNLWTTNISHPQSDLVIVVKANWTEHATSYDGYLSYLESQLQRPVEYPDLVVLDSILVQDYRAKGAFEPVDFYLDSDSANDLQRLLEASLGRAPNGHVVGLAVTRNFHLPAKGVYFKPSLGEATIESRSTWADKRNTRVVGLERQFRAERFNFDDLVQWDAQNQSKCGISFFQEFESKWQSTYKDRKPYTDLVERAAQTPKGDIPFVIEIGGSEPFIPMQLARGAHVTFTLFAYLANCGGHKSLVELTGVDDAGAIRVSILNKANMQVRLEKLLVCIFQYVPLISLCLDQSVAGKLRDAKQNLWFDPCLPIEGAKFQETHTDFGDKPAVTSGNQSLSCLGGYCIGLTSRSRDKRAAAKAAFAIATSHYERMHTVRKENTTSIKAWSDFQMAVRYGIVGGVPSDGHKDFNSEPTVWQFAQRPGFVGWKVIEEHISEIVRPYILALLIYRSIVAEAVAENMATAESGGSEQSLEKLLLEKKAGPGRSLTTALEKDIQDFIKGLSDHITSYSAPLVEQSASDEFTRWVELNIGDLEADSNQIRALIEEAVSLPSSVVRAFRHFSVISKFADRLSHTLQKKLVSQFHALSAIVDE